MISRQALEDEFHDILGVSPPSAPYLAEQVDRLLDRLTPCRPVAIRERRIRLLALVNGKFDINRKAVQDFLAWAAQHNTLFNYQEKKRLKSAFDRCDIRAFQELLHKKNAEHIIQNSSFCPTLPAETIKRLHGELRHPTLVRKDSRPKDWSGAIKQSLFGGFVFEAFPKQHVHAALTGTSSKAHYEPTFWRYLQQQNQKLFSREKALVFLRIDTPIEVNKLTRFVEAEFEQLSNHGHLAIQLPIADGWGWKAAAYTILFAEKFQKTQITNNYFNWREIERITKSHNQPLGNENLRFDIADTGYYYRDTFIIGDGASSSLLILLQKNVPDETAVPCPACRTSFVQGNSYSSLGVKSWECQNPLCPDRSKFNRGKRYSFHQILKQQAIEDPLATISKESIRKWSRDIQPQRSTREVISMLIRHYSLPNDGVAILGATPPESLGRNITHQNVTHYLDTLNSTSWTAFSERNFFKRYAFQPTSQKFNTHSSLERHVGPVRAICGNSRSVLRELLTNSIDGAVTSPPYYNAREYSQWPNIYCYLHDLYAITAEVFRILKPGGTYLFNIFDYYDNENVISTSAMGEKRLILSAYCVDIFERVGFECAGNIAWDKGEIEGKRAFNNGNFSPLYQSPFNCWEHILIFQKPGAPPIINETMPSHLKQKPVIKMIKGTNRHGHSAPFPEAIPELLLRRLSRNSTVLDPFAGSMTTGLAAMQLGCKAICIELNRTYFDLGIAKLTKRATQGDLF